MCYGLHTQYCITRTTKWLTVSWFCESSLRSSGCLHWTLWLLASTLAVDLFRRKFKRACTWPREDAAVRFKLHPLNLRHILYTVQYSTVPYAVLRSKVIECSVIAKMELPENDQILLNQWQNSYFTLHNSPHLQYKLNKLRHLSALLQCRRLENDR